MPLVASAAFATAVESGEYTWTVRLTLGLPASDYVDFSRALSGLSLNTQVTTDFPDGIRDTAGYSTLGGDITLAGSVDPHGDEKKTAAWLFNPDSPDSPLRHLDANGATVTVEAGLYVPGSADPELVTVFTGWVNGYDMDHADGTVILHVVDQDPAWAQQILTAAALTDQDGDIDSGYVMASLIQNMTGDPDIAVLDPSLNPLTVVPAVDTSTAPWDELQTVAAAELGYLRRTPDGKIRFSNRQTLLTQPVSRTVSSRTSLETLATTVPASSTYRHIQVPYTEWTFGDPTAVWTASGRRRIPARSTHVFTVTIDGAAAIASPAALLPDGHDPNDGGSWFRASNDKHGLSAHGDTLTITLEQLTTTTVRVTAVNTGGNDAYLVTPATYTDLDAGTSGFWIGGTPVTPSDEETVDVIYGDGAGTYPVPSNAYLQDNATASAVGAFLLGQLAFTVRDYTGVAIVPDVRVQAGDLIRLQDLDAGSGVDEYAFVWGWSLEATPATGGDAGTFDMTLDVRALGPPDAWLGGQIPDRAEVETSWAYG